MQFSEDSWRWDNTDQSQCSFETFCPIRIKIRQDQLELDQRTDRASKAFKLGKLK